MGKRLQLAQRIAERKRHEGQERRRRILDASRKLFAEKGYLRASMRDIALEAALSPGLIYHYWGGKDDLYGVVCEEAFHLLLDYCRRAGQGEHAALERLFLCARAYVRFYRDYPQYFDIISFRDLGFKQVNISVPILQRIEKLSHEVLELYQGLVAECMEEGSIRRSEEPWRTGMALWASVEGLVFIDRRGYLETFSQDLDKVLDDLLSTLLNGAKP
jgi:AcrR family transcriptional regulator